MMLRPLRKYGSKAQSKTHFNRTFDSDSCTFGIVLRVGDLVLKAISHIKKGLVPFKFAPSGKVLILSKRLIKVVTSEPLSQFQKYITFIDAQWL